jgi:hypothetical protein
MHFSSPKTVAENPDRGPVTTFDFYDTMTRPEFDRSLKTWRRGVSPNYFILSEMVRLHNEGWKVVIVTDEHKNGHTMGIIKEFKRQHELPSQGIIYTAGNEKAAFLGAINSVLHYDDDPYEIECLLVFNITGILVPHPSEYLTQEDYHALLSRCD